jgi:hypothetical protein
MEDAMKVFFVLLAAALVVGCTHSSQQEATGTQTQSAKTEADLAAALSGRVAGQAQDCVSERDLGENKAYGKDVIVFKGRTDEVVYVNRLLSPCPGLEFGRAIAFTTPQTRICRGDLVNVFDPVTGVQFGGCGLGEFTPYRRSP